MTGLALFVRRRWALLAAALEHARRNEGITRPGAIFRDFKGRASTLLHRLDASQLNIELVILLFEVLKSRHSERARLRADGGDRANPGSIRAGEIELLGEDFRRRHRGGRAEGSHLARRAYIARGFLFNSGDEAIRRVGVFFDGGGGVHIFQMQVLIIAEGTAQNERRVGALAREHVLRAEQTHVVLAAAGRQHRAQMAHADRTGVFEQPALLLGRRRQTGHLQSVLRSQRVDADRVAVLSH